MNFSNKRKNREEWDSAGPARAGSEPTAAGFLQVSANDYNQVRKNRERWVTPNPTGFQELTISLASATQRVTVPTLSAGQPDPNPDPDPDPPPPPPPVGDSGLPGIGDNSQYIYDPSHYGATSAATNFNPASTDPLTRGCPEYSDPLWPRVCPQKGTWAWYEQIMQSVMTEANVYRAAKGFDPLILDRHLALAGFRHAVFICETWDANYASPNGQMVIQHGGFALHWEPATNSFGDTIVNRVGNTGRGLSGSYAEGIGYNLPTPMRMLCAMKSDYVSEAQPGHFGPFYTNAAIKYVGLGFDARPSDGQTYAVWTYASDPPAVDATVLDELYLEMPKLDCF